MNNVRTPSLDLKLLEYRRLDDWFSQDFFKGDFRLNVSLTAEPIADDFNYVIGSKHTSLLSKLLGDISPKITENPNNDRRIALIIANDLTNFDMDFFGVLALVRPRFPSIKIEIALRDKSDFGSYARFRDSLSKLTNFYELLSGQRLFSIKNEASFHSDLKEPEDPLLIFPVNTASFNSFFIETNHTWNGSDIFNTIDRRELSSLVGQLTGTGSTAADQNFAKVAELIKKLAGKINFKNNNPTFYSEYLYMLANLNLLQEEFNFLGQAKMGFNFQPFEKGGFGSKMAEVQIRALETLNELKEYPSFMIFLFSVLVNRNIGTIVIKSETDGKNASGKADLFIHRFNELFEFSKNIFLSIRELARNIINHTESRSGVITGRVYSAENLPQLKENETFDRGLTSYLTQLDIKRKSYHKGKYFFELSIIDEGKIGIVPKTIQNIKRLNQELNAKSEFYLEDIKRLEEGSITLADFFNYNDIKLNHHAIKTASHWGLIIFSNLIHKNDGYFFVSTTTSVASQLDYCYFNSEDAPETRRIAESGAGIHHGTHYNIILPLDRNHGLSIRKSGKPFKENNFSAENFDLLLHYRVFQEQFKLSSSDRNAVAYYDVALYKPGKTGSEDYRNEILIAQQIGEEIWKHQQITDVIPVLNFDGCEDYFDQSRLLRFLGQLQMTYNVHDIIVLNLKASNIMPLREIVSDTIDKYDDKQFWDPDHFVLIYSYKQADGRRDYHTDILGGYNYRDLKKLKSKLSLSQNTLFFSADPGGDFSPEITASLKKSKLFRTSNPGVVQNFELILTHGTKTLFEISLANTLNSTVSKNQGKVTGYKISNTHFRLGSKTHITAFVYAKRIFQNSFFSDRFSFLVAKYVFEYIKDAESKGIKNLNKLTVLGYGDYSQLLINRTTEILKKIFKDKDFNNNIISDAEDFKLLKPKNLQENVIILVPINTTFSTAIKIEKAVHDYRDGKVNNIIPINLILVSHDDLDKPAYLTKLNEYLTSDSVDQNDIYPYKLFNWKHVDQKKRTVTVVTNPPNEKKTFQRYFITIPSNWTSPDTCEKCFPVLRNDLEETGLDYRLFEKPLLETDKTSVTPDLLLEIPRNFVKELHGLEEITYKRPVFLNEEALSSSHQSKWNNHYLYFIDPNSFFDTYRTEIDAWAAACAKKLAKEIPDIRSKNILLISSSKNVNAYFIEYINRTIFDDSAIINHYEIGEDYIENFEKFFSHDIMRSNYIFFVDDFVHSGKTFHLINDFVRHCRNNLVPTEQKDRSISCNGLFTLINKADNYCQNDIADLLKRDDSSTPWMFSFFHWKDIHTTQENCPLCKERVRYIELAKASMLDTVRHFFLNKVRSLDLAFESEDKKFKSKWSKYHPLVVETGLLPWEMGCLAKTEQIWQSYQQNAFPGKDYVKMLVQHSINELLSNNEEIRDFIENDPAGSTEAAIIQKNKELIPNIIKELMKMEPYKLWYDNYNDATQEVFDHILKEIVIKTLTQHPFKNIKPVRERIFSWILSDLTEKIAEFKTSEKLVFERLSFQKFRYIKFLLRRVTLLGSNFIIDKKTLEEFRMIYSTANQSYSSAIENLRKKQLEKFETVISKFEEDKAVLSRDIKEINKKSGDTDLELRELETRNHLDPYELMKKSAGLKEQAEHLKRDKTAHTLKLEEIEIRYQYVLQAKTNLVYKDVSVKEFGYFYVSLIKELTLNNESKLITIERNVSEILSSLNMENEQHYYFLLRLIKLENISILKGFINILQSHLADIEEISFATKCWDRISEIKAAIKKALEQDYRLTSFKLFFNIDDIDQWLNSASCHSIVHLLYVLQSIEQEKLTPNSELHFFKSKSKAILNNLYRMVCDPNHGAHNFESKSESYKMIPGSGAFLALRYKNNDAKITQPDDIILTNVLIGGEKNNRDNEDSNSKSAKLMETSVDSDSMVYLMMNGVSGNKKLSFKEKESPNVELVYEEYPLKPWTILEMSLHEKSGKKVWNVNRGPVYPVNNAVLKATNILHYGEDPQSLDIDYYFNEYSVIDEESTYMAFLRIAELETNKRAVKNRGKAVFGFYSKEEIPLDRLRFMLLLNQHLNSFFSDHYEQDSIVAFLEEKERNAKSNKLKHGYLKFIGSFYQTALPSNDAERKAQSEMTPEELKENDEFKVQMLDLYRNQLEVGPLLENNYEKLRNPASQLIHKEDLVKTFQFDIYNRAKLTSEIQTIFRIVYGTGFKNTDKSNVELTVDNTAFPGYIDFGLYVKTLRYLITELFVNANRSQKTLENSEVKGIMHVKIEYTITEDLILTFRNNYTSVIREGEKYRLMKGNFKYSTRGLGLVTMICEQFYQNKPKITIVNDNYFSIIINIPK